MPSERASSPGRPRAGLFLVLVAAVPAIGLLDIATGPDLGMSLFYILPVGAGAWWLGRWPAVLLAFLAGGSWLTADLVTGASPASLWNAFTRLVMFSLVAVLLDNVRQDRRRLTATVERLDVERARQEALIGALREALVVVDDEGRIERVNERAGELFGHGVVGRQVTDVIPLLATDRPQRNGRWTGRLTDAFGMPIEVEVSRAAMGDPTATRSAAYVVHDVTHHAELSRMREQLLYSVAHELRGPLGVLENALDILAAEYGDLSADEFGRLSGSAVRTAHRLRTLMEDLLSAGSIQSGRFTIVQSAVPVRELVDEAVDAVGIAVSERSQRIDVDVGSAGLAVRCDRRYARQVLTNLLANASKYAPHGTSIKIVAERQDGDVRIAVTDSGPGIPPDELPGLFERFYRMRRDAAEPGIGLGLAIVKGIVEAHGGRIGIESVVGKGTTVWFTLPAEREAAAA